MERTMGDAVPEKQLDNKVDPESVWVRVAFCKSSPRNHEERGVRFAGSALRNAHVCFSLLRLWLLKGNTRARGGGAEPQESGNSRREAACPALYGTDLVTFRRCPSAGGPYVASSMVFCSWRSQCTNFLTVRR